MKTPTWKNQKLGTVDGFKIELSFEEEYDLEPRHHFINECGWSAEEYNAIKNFYWFTAKITVYLGSIECGSAYLCECCYKSLKEIMNNKQHKNILSGYAPQMINEAIDEAKARLAA